MSNNVTAVANRYSDAYIVARTINGLGATIKAIGLTIGAVIAVGSLAAANGPVGKVAAVGGIVLASLVATVFYLFGTIASAQGQILKATLDTAVNTSRWLSDDDRARIMSLPVASAPSGAATRAAWRCRCGQQNPAGAGACLECGQAA